ncbi:MAG: hypothetical protein R2849_22580 [Thermomicrobiales bacterium]
MLDTNVARQDNREEGQVIVLFALLSFVMIGALALALDVGYLFLGAPRGTERRRMPLPSPVVSHSSTVKIMGRRGLRDCYARRAAISYASANGNNHRR